MGLSPATGAGGGSPALGGKPGGLLRAQLIPVEDIKQLQCF